MLSILLIVAGAFFHEVATSFGKEEVMRRKETIYTYGFLRIFTIPLLLLVDLGLGYPLT